MGWRQHGSVLGTADRNADRNGNTRAQGSVGRGGEVEGWVGGSAGEFLPF